MHLSYQRRSLHANKKGHLAVLFYEPDASKVFPSTDIKGGVVVTLYDYTKTYGAIGTFTPYKGQVQICV